MEVLRSSLTSRRSSARKSSIGDLPTDCLEFSKWKENQDSCLFFRLPAELRLVIYEQVLGRHTIYIQYGGYAYRTIKTNHGKRRLESRHLPGFHCTRCPRDSNPFTAILCSKKREASRGLQLLNNISRDFYQDAALLPYKWNTWAFQSAEIMRMFIVKERRLPLANLDAINSVFSQAWDPKSGINWAPPEFSALVDHYKAFSPRLKILHVDGPTSIGTFSLETETEVQREKDEAIISWQKFHGNPPYDFL